MPQAQTDTRPHIVLFTDGSCSGNPGPGGWAFILRDNSTGREIHVADGEARTTNNRMELLGVIKGLERLKEPCRVDLYSDSQYVVFGLKSWMDDWKAKGWKRSRRSPVKNLELWKQLDELRHRHEINPIWIRGHSDHPENQRCDQLAVEAARRVKQGEAADFESVLD